MNAHTKAGRIIIADDVPHVRASLRLMFTTLLGLEVVGEAATAGELIALLATTPTDFVLVDRDIPGLEDPTQVEEIRRRAPESRILLVSVFERDEGQRDCHLKADFTISKSLGPDHWLGEMHRLIAEKPPGVINLRVEKPRGVLARMRFGARYLRHGHCPRPRHRRLFGHRWDERHMPSPEHD